MRSESDAQAAAALSASSDFSVDGKPPVDQHAAAQKAAHERLYVLASALLEGPLSKDFQISSLLPRGNEKAQKDKSPEGDGVLNFAPELSESEKALQGQAVAFGAAHHLETRSENGQFEYAISVGGEKRQLFSVQATEAGLKEADLELRKLTDGEKQSLTKTYGVEFAASGEPVGYQRDTSDSQPSTHMVLAREPELLELYGIRSALEKSSPGNIGPDGRSVKFYALSEKVISQINPVATFQADKDGRGSVYIWPAASDVKYVTEADLSDKEKQLSYFDENRPMSLQYAFTHELGHNNSMKLGLERRSDINEGATDFTPAGEKLANEMGWVKRRDTLNSGQDWLLVGRSLDDNGQNATYLPEPGVFETSWLRWRADGGIVDKDGKVVPAQDGQRLSAEAMVNQAKIKPVSWYFPEPGEMYAESICHYRLSPQSRRDLADSSPELYRLIKGVDQREIDNQFGMNADGSSRMIRLPDGVVVANNDDNRATVAEFEAPDKTMARQ